jgi:hypothetical protein
MHSLLHVALITAALCMETSPIIAGSYPGLGKEGAIFLQTFGHAGIHKKVAVLSGRMNHTPTQYSFMDVIVHYKHFFPFPNRSSLQSLVPAPMNKTTIRVLSTICNCNLHLLLKYSRGSFAFALQLPPQLHCLCIAPSPQLQLGPRKRLCSLLVKCQCCFIVYLLKTHQEGEAVGFWFGGGSAGQPGL